MTIDAYPLQWPAGVERTVADEREHARFSRRVAVKSQYSDHQWMQNKSLTLSGALNRLHDAIGKWQCWRIDPDDVVVSTNLRTRLDGLPRSGQRMPDDPGVAVYFWLDDERRCIPCDRWLRIEDNIAAVAGALEALRSLERWVNDAQVRAAFTGFAALPAPGASEHWRDVLNVPGGEFTREQVMASYRSLAGAAHPDKGGSDAEMARLNWARAAALAEVGA